MQYRLLSPLGHLIFCERHSEQPHELLLLEQICIELLLLDLLLDLLEEGGKEGRRKGREREYTTTVCLVGASPLRELEMQHRRHCLERVC